MVLPKIMIIIGGSSSTGLAKEVADLVGCRYIEAESTRFPDGECYTRIEAESLDDDVAIIQNTYPDGNMMEMFLLQDIVRGMGAKSVTLVIPYFGYARQDRLFKPGEPESAKVMCNLLDRVCDRVITIDIHKEAVLDHFSCAHCDLKAAAAIAQYFGDKAAIFLCSFFPFRFHFGPQCEGYVIEYMYSFFIHQPPVCK